MRPIHILVIGAVVAVGAVLYLMLDDSTDRHQSRTGSERSSDERGRKGGGDEGKDGDGRDKAAKDSGLVATLSVLQADGTAAQGATIELSGDGTGTRTADDKGVARLSGLRPGYYNAMASHGDAVGALSFTLAESGDVGTITLAQAVWIRGTVYDAQGKPVHGATVEAVTSVQMRGWSISALIGRMTAPEAATAHTVTEQDGAYALKVASGDSLALRVNAPGFGQEAEAGRRYTANVEGLDFYLFPGTNVAGTVVTSQGMPVAGARVILVDPMAVFAQRVPKAETLTADDGTFGLSITPSQQMILVTRATGYAANMEQVTLPASELKITLEAGITVRIRAVEAGSGGAPAPGVTIALTYKGGFQLGESDENGELIVENMPTSGPRGWGSQEQLFLWGGGYVAKTEKLEKAEVKEGLLDLGDIEVTLGGIIRGKVYDKDTQEPVGGAKVRTFGGLDMQLQWMETTSALSKKDGTFELTGVPLKATVLSADHPEYVSPVDPMQMMTGMRSGKPLFPDGDRELKRDVALKPAHAVTGVVVGPDGTPVAGAKVSVKDDQNNWVRMLMGGVSDAFSDADGRFRLGGLKQKQSVKLFATHRSFGASESLTTVAGAGDAITLTLAEPIEIRGKVVNPNGDPVAGVRVTAARAKEDRPANPMMPTLTDANARPAVTNDKGEYILRNAPEGDLVVTFDHKDFVVLKQPIRTVAGAAADALTATLERGHGFEGIVVDEKGEPVPTVTVNATMGGQNMMTPGRQTNAGGGRTWANGSTDEKGRFSMYGLREGQFTLRCYRQGYYSRPLTVETGTKEARLVVEPEGTVGRVTANGKPVSGANLNAQAPGPSNTPGQSQGNFLAWAQTDADGKFTLKPLPPNRPFKLVIMHQGYKQTTVENVTASGTTQRDFQMEPGLRIGGIVVDEQGDPVQSAGIMVKQASGKSSWAQSGTDGKWELGGLEAGEITVELSPGAFVKTDSITTAPGDMTIRIVAVRGEAITGTVLVAGDATMQARIDAIDADGKVANTAWIWGKNRGFAIRGLRAGRYTIKVTRFGPTAVAVPGGEAPKEEVLAAMSDVRTGTTDLELDLR